MELWILTFVLIMIRTSTFLAAMPLFGIRTLPKTVLVGLSLCLSYMWYANLTQPPEHLTQYAAGYFEWFGFFMAGFRESLVGLLLGTAFGLLLYPLQTAGSYLSQEMSMTNANLTDPSTQTNSNVMSVLFQTLGLLMIFTLGLHRICFQGPRSFFRTLAHWPPVDAGRQSIDGRPARSNRTLGIVNNRARRDQPVCRPDRPGTVEQGVSANERFFHWDVRARFCGFVLRFCFHAEPAQYCPAVNVLQPGLDHGIPGFPVKSICPGKKTWLANH